MSDTGELNRVLFLPLNGSSLLIRTADSIAVRNVSNDQSRKLPLDKAQDIYFDADGHMIYAIPSINTPSYDAASNTMVTSRPSNTLKEISILDGQIIREISLAKP